MWVAVEKDGNEVCFNYKPQRVGFNGKYPTVWRDVWGGLSENDLCDNRVWGQYLDSFVVLPQDSILKLSGKVLTWEDEPVEI